MAVIGDSLRGTLGTYLPTWLQNVPGLRRLFSVLWTIALIGDCFREIVLEGQFAAYPGVGTSTALPLIGASRGLVQGPSEPNATFATRCMNWLSIVAEMGGHEGLVRVVQAYLIGQGSLGAGVYPVVAFVDRAGHMTIANADRSITETVVTWNWDEVAGWVDGKGYNPPPVVDGWCSDGWLLIQDPYTHYTGGFTDPNWLAAWNSGDQTIDSLTPQLVVAQLENIVDVWKGAHIYVRCIAWVPNPATFTPTGSYGNWSRNQGGTQIAARNGAYSYWQPVPGG
jgi:hypothetical protein